MSIPKTVSEALENLDVEYSIIRSNEPLSGKATAEFLGTKTKGLLRIVCLKGKDKPLAVVLPYNSLLDIRQFEEDTGHNIELTPEQHIGKLFKGCDPGQRPPIPGAFEFNWIVDSSVLKLDEAFLSSGNSKAIISLKQPHLVKLFESATHTDFTVSSEELYTGRVAGQNSGGDLDVSFTPLRLKQRVDETFDLPAMPEIAQDIMKLRVDPSADAAKLAAIVCRDPSLAAQVISWASSPYYGYQGKVDSVETAIARVLGFELVMNLALGISIGKSLKVPFEGPLGIRQFWKQAIYSANLAEKLCRSMPIKQRPERGLIYLSGLLHNFGHLLLGHVFPPQFELVNRTIEANPHISIEDIEFYILGVTHEEIGAWLMHNWHMPDELIVAVRRHHQEEFWSKHAVYSNLVLVANRLLKRLGIGDSVETELPASTLELLSLDLEKVEESLKDIESESENLDSMAKQLVA